MSHVDKKIINYFFTVCQDIHLFSMQLLNLIINLFQTRSNILIENIILHIFIEIYV